MDWLSKAPLEKVFRIYKFETTIKKGKDLAKVTDTRKHFSIEKAIEDVRKYNQERGFDVVDIKIVSAL